MKPLILSRLTLFLILVFPVSDCFAQKESWHWYFGSNAGLDFSSGSPAVVTNGVLNTYEGVASISDSNGNLLFYTDGKFVYNATHAQMPNGFGLLGDGSSTQSAIIAKKPGSNNLYYIFTVDYNQNGGGTGNGFNYSIVDMSLNGLLGDVSVKNVFIRSHVFEKLTAVKHGNNTDFWIIINDWLADDIYAYLLDSSGFNLTPVISGVGPFHNQDAGMTAGYIKANRQGNKLALAMWQKQSYDLLDFDNTTGIASNHILIQSSDMNWTYGVEFSPDGTKLYGTALDPPSHLFQFDLTAGNPAAILASRITLGTSNILYYYSALQIAPDGKIYCAHRYDFYVGVINQPDSAGISSNAVDSGIYLNGKQCALGLPNFVPGYVFPSGTVPAIALASSDTLFCEKQCIDFFDLSTNNPASWQWYFPGANPDTSTLQNPTGICYNSYGSYAVTLISCNSNGCDSLHLANFISCFQNPVDSIYSSGDTLYSLQAYSYQWYEITSGIIAGETNQHYVPVMPGSYYCVVTDSIGCEATSNIIVLTSLSGLITPNEGITIIPNPNNGSFEIKFDSDNPFRKQVEFSIFNSLGQLVLHSSSENNNSLRIKTDLQKGIYSLLITTGQEIVTQRFQVVR